MLMLFPALYIPAFAEVSATEGYLDEGEIPYFNTFAKEEDIEGREFTNKTVADEWREVSVENGSLKFLTVMTAVIHTYQRKLMSACLKTLPHQCRNHTHGVGSRLRSLFHIGNHHRKEIAVDIF